MLETGLAWAAQTEGLRKVSLAVMADNAPAIALYERLGFVIEGRRVGEIEQGSTLADDLIMGLILPGNC